MTGKGWSETPIEDQAAFVEGSTALSRLLESVIFSPLLAADHEIVGLRGRGALIVSRRCERSVQEEYPIHRS